MYKVEVNPKIALFDTFVGSILSNGCQFWGFTKCKGIERIQLKQIDNIILKTIYCVAIEDSDRGMNNWITKVKQLLNEHGLTYAWDNAHMLCHKQFISLFKQRVTDWFL